MSQVNIARVRCGFTLIELLVVMGILATLIALLIPAVQKVRESAAFTQCSNNLKQLALAARQHESSLRRFPPGYLGPRNNKSIDTAVAYGDAEDNQWVGHLPVLLPYLEQVSLFQQIQVKFDPDVQGPPWWEPKPTATGPLPTNFQVALQILPIFVCPSNPNTLVPFQAGSSRGTVVGFHIYHTGPFTKFHRWVENYDDGTGNPYSWRLAPTNYAGVCGAGTGTSPWWGQWEGVYTNRSRTRVTDIVDGTSNTVLYGEVAGRAEVDATTNEVVGEALNISWFGVGVVTSGTGLEAGQQALWNQFSSYHSHGVQFAFADGSVRTLSFAIDASVLLQLSGMRDGTPPPVIE